MPENKPYNPGKPHETLRWKIFVVYLGASLGLILGLNGILLINNNQLFGDQSFLIGIVLIGFIFIFLTILFWLVLRKILSPLNELIKSVQVFLDGNWEQRIYLQNNDEAGILAEQFNVILDEMVNLYVSQETVIPMEATPLPAPSSLSPGMEKMAAAQEIDELINVTVEEISRNLQADKARLLIIAKESERQKLDFSEIVRGNGHEGEP